MTPVNLIASSFQKLRGRFIGPTVLLDGAEYSETDLTRNLSMSGRNPRAIIQGMNQHTTHSYQSS